MTWDLPILIAALAAAMFILSILPAPRPDSAEAARRRETADWNWYVRTKGGR